MEFHSLDPPHFNNNNNNLINYIALYLFNLFIISASTPCYRIAIAIARALALALTLTFHSAISMGFA